MIKSTSSSEKKPEIPVTSQHEFRQAESNERSSNNTSKNLKEEVSRVESWCRICQESTSEVLVSPCRCRGTQGLVHLSCLERWLTISGTSACEVCFYQYCVKSVPKYSPFTSIFVWMYKDANKKFMACDIAILVMLTTTMLWMLKLAWYLKIKDNPQYMSAGAGILIFIFTVIYIFLVYLIIRYYYKKWLTWHKTNRLGLRLILPPECCSIINGK